jgi:hypothetical protein
VFMRLCGLFEIRFPTPPEGVLVRPSPCLNPGGLRNRLLLRSYFAFAAFSLLLLAALNAHGARPAVSATDEGIRVEVPLDGQLRIENRFGDVNVNVTQQKDVLVAATISGVTALKQTPVVIERKNSVLLISVLRDAREPQVRVNLTVRIPETVRAEIVTTDGAITSRGVSTSLSLNTISGWIHAGMAPPLDVDVIARSIEGRVRSEIGADGGTDSHSFRSRFGAGRQILRVNSQRG